MRNGMPQRIATSAVWLMAVICLAVSARESRGEDPPPRVIALYQSSKLRFVDRAEGARFLAEPDAFVRGLSRFDLQVRLKTDGAATRADYLAMTQAELLDWSDEEVARLSDIVQSLKEKLELYDLPIPEDVLLLKYTGSGEAGAAYTRRNGIVLPRRMIDAPPRALERLLLHELFHIFSRHDEPTRQVLYAIIGFKPCNPIDLPESIAKLKISNPDAPTIDYYITLETPEAEGQPARVQYAVPILLADDAYDAEKGGDLFDYLRFRLLEIHKQDGRWQPRMVASEGAEAEPILIDPNEAAAYHRQIGRNTSYIIHPDEILADNFVLLVLGQEQLPSPQIVAEMHEALLVE